MNVLTTDSQIQIDPGERVFIDLRLSGLFPDKQFHVSMPKPHWHMIPEEETDHVHVSINIKGTKILISAFDKANNSINPNFGEGDIEISLNPKDPENMRFQIQYALGRFHGLPHAYQNYSDKLEHLDL